MGKNDSIKIRIKSCLGCYVYESGRHSGYCSLGYKTEKIKLVGGFYGKDKQYIVCDQKPIEICPKPRTTKQYLKAWKEREDFFKVKK
jgi:hypothetical protein